MSDPSARLRAVVTRFANAIGHNVEHGDVYVTVKRRRRGYTRGISEWSARASVAGTFSVGIDIDVEAFGATAETAADAAIVALWRRVEAQRESSAAEAERAASRTEMCERALAALEREA